VSEAEVLSQPAESPEGSTEERIFRAALAVFARKGRDGARMQEIADVAGINKAMLHYYFRSKERLYEQVFEHVFGHFERLLSESVEADPAEPFAATLDTFCERYLAFASQRTDVLHLLVHEFLAGGQVARASALARLTRGGAPPQRFVAHALAAMERSEIRRLDPRQLLLTVISSCIFPFLAAPLVALVVPEIEHDRARFVAERHAFLVDSLLRALTPDPT
jgi:TetR/AcrR family transcriptional regulator